MVEFGLSLGSNLGDKGANIHRAVAELEASGALREVEISRLYRTPPWGKTDQDWFVNACLVARTGLAPAELLALCQACERRMGRRRIVRWGPRNIDIDILYMDDLVVHEPELELPHPEMFNRAFVLVPLADLRPNLTIGGRTLSSALAVLPSSGIVPLDEVRHGV